MHFIKLSRSYINLDNVTAIVPEAEGNGYVVGFVGQREFCGISAADMVYIRRELEKIKKLQDLDKIVIQERIADGDRDFEMANHQNEWLLKIVRHHKYKRCLAMARLCAWEQRFWGDGMPAYERQFQWENRAVKWKKRWLELAKKFKEAK